MSDHALGKAIVIAETAGTVTSSIGVIPLRDWRAWRVGRYRDVMLSVGQRCWPVGRISSSLIATWPGRVTV
jgi:hypothetical protein